MSNKFMTVIYDVSQPEMKEKAKKLLADADWTAAGWSHAFADRDEARAALCRLQESSAAAPQVVADERELSLLYGIGRTIIGLRDGWGDKNDADEAIANIAEVKSALAAAPVQSSIAQPLQKRDPVEFSLALIAEWDEGPQDMDTWGSHASTQLMQLVHLVHEARMGRIISHCAPTAPVQAQEPMAGKPCPYCGSTDGAHDKAYPHPRAPVQPVAVPDGEEFGFKAVRLRRTAFLLGLEGAIPDNDKDLMDCMGAVLGMICREVERRAAPAAQVDAKDEKAELVRAGLTLMVNLKTVKDELEALKGDAKDAERYRYIRDTETIEAMVWEALDGDGSVNGEGELDRAGYAAGMDRAIDAAIAAKAAS